MIGVCGVVFKALLFLIPLQQTHRFLDYSLNPLNNTIMKKTPSNTHFVLKPTTPDN